MARVHNFNPGPSALPLEALERARDEMLDFNNTGMSIMELSHRGAVYEAVHEEATSLIKELLGVPDTHDILFYQGGATAQFALVPMNLRPLDKSADYVTTGVWGQKALKEAKHNGGLAREAATTIQDGKFFRVPKNDEIDRDPNAAYLHFCSNNTVMGTQFAEFPTSPGVPLICDMSSDIMSRRVQVADFGLIYAGAQKNMGPSGITLVIVRKDLVETGRKDIPFVFQYRTQAEAHSLANTIPTFGVYMLRNVLDWLKKQGGLAAIETVNRKKAEQLYSVLEERCDLYKLSVERESRSLMNVVWSLPSPEEDKACVAAAAEAGLVGLKGHRIVGGLRASIFNAVSPQSVDALCEFLRSYRV
jgi:phosphoserine aminotransferase